MKTLPKKIVSYPVDDFSKLSKFSLLQLLGTCYKKVDAFTAFLKIDEFRSKIIETYIQIDSIKKELEARQAGIRINPQMN